MRRSPWFRLNCTSGRPEWAWSEKDIVLLGLAMQALETLIAVRTRAASSARERFIDTLLHKVVGQSSTVRPETGAQKLNSLGIRLVSQPAYPSLPLGRGLTLGVGGGTGGVGGSARNSSRSMS